MMISVAEDVLSFCSRASSLIDILCFHSVAAIDHFVAAAGIGMLVRIFEIVASMVVVIRLRVRICFKSIFGHYGLLSRE
jgi:hypothetical protein